MALALLLEEWVRHRGGRLEALTVDHGLRPEAARDAAEVGRRLRGTFIHHHVLRWLGPKPRSGIQQAARQARYGLLFDWCARAGVLHLFVAHHLQDQAETFLLRVGRGSGKKGLAGMSRVVEHRAVRLLRPCLATDRSRLHAVLQQSGAEAVHDPSNEDRSFARVRVRSRLPAMANQGLPAGRLAAAAAALGQSRQDLEREVAVALATTSSLHPSGYVLIRPAEFRGLPQRMQAAVMEAVLCTVGSRPRPPRRRPLDSLCMAVGRCGGRGGDGFVGATLGGCRISWHRGNLLICREPAAALQEVVVEGPVQRLLWDSRFEMALHVHPERAPPVRLSVGRLGKGGWTEIVGRMPALRRSALPWPARTTLPAIRDAEGILLVPHLGYRHAGTKSDGVRVESLVFRPARPLAGAGFMLA